MTCANPKDMHTEFEVAKLWCSEAYRTLVDRVDDREERRMFQSIIHDLAEKNFKFGSRNERLPQKLGRPYFGRLFAD